MPKQINYHLNTDELSTIRRAIARDKRAEVRHRATAIHLLHQDQKPQAVVETLAVTMGSSYKWHHRWRTQGLNGLADLPRSGAPPKADEAYWQRLGEVLEREPQTLGYAFTLWTAKRLVAHMASETGITLSISRLRSVLHARLCLSSSQTGSCKSARLRGAHRRRGMATSAKKRALAGEFILLFVDETTLTLHPRLHACWMKRGTQKRIPTPGQQQWHHLFGAYNFVTDEVITLPTEAKNSDNFVALLDLLVQQLPADVPILLVLDNASYHHSRTAYAAFALLEHRIRPLFLPAYCSMLNPIERFWQHLKDLATANVLHTTMTALVDLVQTHLLNQHVPSHPDRFTLCKNL